VAMSQENLEIASRALAAALRKPEPDFATVNALYHAEHELVTPISRLEGGALRGIAGFRAWMSGIGEDWDSWDPRIDRVAEIDEQRVLIVWWFKARSRRGNVPVEQENAFVVTVRDGKVLRSENYSSPDEALAAARLTE